MLPCLMSCRRDLTGSSYDLIEEALSSYEFDFKNNPSPRTCQVSLP